MVPRPSNQQHRPDTKRRILLRPLLLLLPIPLLLLLLLPSANSVLLFRRRSRRPPRRPRLAPCRLRPRGVERDGSTMDSARDFPRDSATWTPSSPPRNRGGSRILASRILRYGWRRISTVHLYRSGSVETQRSSLAGNIFEDFLSPSSQGRSLDTRVSLYPSSLSLPPPLPPPLLLFSRPSFLFRPLFSRLSNPKKFFRFFRSIEIFNPLSR